MNCIPRERERERAYPVERGVEGVFGDGFLQAAPEGRGGVLDGERGHPIPRRHCCVGCWWSFLRIWDDCYSGIYTDEGKKGNLI